MTKRLANADRYEPVRAKSARLYAHLRAEILAARLRPGDALSENALAEHHGISRTPVREVFQRLAADGLLRIVPQIGSFVAPINLAAVSDSQFAREALECHAVRQAATIITSPQAKRLIRDLDAQRKTVESSDKNAFFALDESLHRAILEIAGHPTVWQVIASVKAQLDRVRYLSLEDANWLGMIFNQHGEIIDRLAARDADGAAQAMTAHLRTVFAAIEKIAEENPDFFENTSPSFAVGQSPLRGAL